MVSPRNGFDARRSVFLSLETVRPAGRVGTARRDRAWTRRPALRPDPLVPSVPSRHHAPASIVSQVRLLGAVSVGIVLALMGVLLWTLRRASDGRAVDLGLAAVFCGLAAVLVLVVLTRRLARTIGHIVDPWLEVLERGTSANLGQRMPRAEPMSEPIRSADTIVDRLEALRRQHDRAIADVERLNADLISSERAARKSQNLLVRACATAGVGGWEVDLAKGTLTWSDETFRLHDVDLDYRPTLETAIGFYAPASRPVIEKAVRDGIEDGLPWDLELELISARGRVFWARVNGTAEYEDGKAVRLVGTIQDITDKIQAQRQLREKSANLEATLDNMQQGLVKIASDRRIELSNRRFAELLGIPAQIMDKAVPHFDDVLTHLDERGEFAAIDQDLLRRARDRGKPLVTGTHERVRPDGQVLEVITSQLVDGSVVSTYTDITARRRAERAVRESEARYRMLADSTSDVITQLDLHLVRQYASPACRAMLGYEPEEMVGLVPSATIHPDDAAAVKEVMLRLAAGTIPGDRATTTNRMRHKLGHWIWLEAAINLVRDPDTGAPKFLICALRDVTERQRAARDLERARAIAENAARIKADFVANMSHELRTPLTGILGIHDLLRTDPTLEPRHRRYLTLAQDAGRALLTIVNDVLDFSKIEAGQLSIEASRFDLETFVKSCRDFGQEDARRKSLEIVSEVDGTPVSLLGDQNRLRQILLNLITNAIKFTERGRIVVAAHYDPDRARLHVAVTDTGIGIAPDKVPSLFGRFTQADTSITRRYGGTGLGLAICKRLVELMDGEIGVRSEPGRGSTFWFELPLPVCKQASAALPNPARSTRAHQPRHVLLAEDNVVNQQIITAMIENDGHRVTVVGNGAAVVAGARSGEFDVILMDIQMPVMDGLSAARLIRKAEAAENRRATPIIGLTANALSEEVARCREAGMDAHVAKPIDWTELFATLDRLAGPARSPEVAMSVPSPVLDERKLSELVGFIGRDRIAKMLGQFVFEIETRVASSDPAGPEELATLTHSLSSLSGQLGFLQLSTLCAEIEREARQGLGLDRLMDLRLVADSAIVAARSCTYF